PRRRSSRLCGGDVRPHDDDAKSSPWHHIQGRIRVQGQRSLLIPLKIANHAGCGSASQAGASLIDRRFHCAAALPIFASFIFQTEAAWLALVVAVASLFLLGGAAAMRFQFTNAVSASKADTKSD